MYIFDLILDFFQNEFKKIYRNLFLCKKIIKIILCVELIGLILRLNLIKKMLVVTSNRGPDNTDF